MSKEIQIYLSDDEMKLLQEWKTHYVTDQNCNIEIIWDIEQEGYIEILDLMNDLYDLIKENKDLN